MTISDLILILAYLASGALFGLIYHRLLRHFAKQNSNRKLSKNIPDSGRVIRLIAGIALLIAGAVTWTTPLFAFAGFCFYEAAFSWCGLNALFGKNECKLN